MRYLSTRASSGSTADRKQFCQILLEGLAPDGGLYLPEHYPQVDDATLVTNVTAFVKQDPKVSVLLGGDKRVDYGRVNQVLGLLQQAGVTKVGLMSQPETTLVPADHGKR